MPGLSCSIDLTLVTESFGMGPQHDIRIVLAKMTEAVHEAEVKSFPIYLPKRWMTGGRLGRLVLGLSPHLCHPSVTGFF